MQTKTYKCWKPGNPAGFTCVGAENARSRRMHECKQILYQILLSLAFSYKPVFFIAEQNIESSQRAIASGNVLLQINFFFFT